MATAQQGFEIGATLLELYKDLPYVKKLGYVVGELGDRILLRVIIEGDCSADEFHEYSMKAVGKAMDFEDMLPADLRDKYEVVPMVTDPDEGALWHFGTMTAVIDR